LSLLEEFTGRVLECWGNPAPRGMIVENKIRLIPDLGFLSLLLKLEIFQKKIKISTNSS
jgi:hypothetical protein